ncbi:MAG TPA: hydrogenase maturation protein [Thiobacillaceae bacterium]|nr:hydrogenase maturation protein [Thiobacillaceae bacterium]HNU63311.1 hydrogenase maturation protein [Thiobacillaceae bacterium]
MRILFLTHAFNSLTQRLYVELTRLGHEVSIEFDINDSVTIEAVDLFRPHLILAPYLRRAIPEAIWKHHLCLVLHPGIVGDRGPSALDWAILKGEREWGVTLLQAEAEMDAGPVWASEAFALRAAKKSSIYRNEVTEATVRVVKTALERLPDYRAGRWQPSPIPLRPMHALMKQADRAIDWARDSTETVLAKLNAADGFPGVKDELFGHPCHLFNAQPFPARGTPGAILGRSGEGLVRATVDGAVRIGHVKNGASPLPLKLPAVLALAETASLPELTGGEWDIRYEEAGGVGYLHFDFYNGAMHTAACQRLLAAYEAARQRPTRAIVLMGGPDFFSNGLDLNHIEAADSPADESWRNIGAMDDLCRAVIETTDRLTVAALQGNAGAGGAFLALAADQVWAREGVILNPHYKNMGNLYGSEYWTYLLPRRLGGDAARGIMARRLPLGTPEAVETGFIDACFGPDPAAFRTEVRQRALALAEGPEFHPRLQDKRARRQADEATRPLAQYRAEELVHMQRNFYGFDPSYHVARHHFVHKTPHSWTPRHLAKHRELGWLVPAEDT